MKMPFNFDRWKRLAMDDPELFEELRQQVIEQHIRSSSPSNQKRLRGLQFQIDAKRKLSGSPMGACIELTGMMFDHLHKELLPALNAFLYNDTSVVKTSAVKNNAEILVFRHQPDRD